MCYHVKFSSSIYDKGRTHKEKGTPKIGDRWDPPSCGGAWLTT